MANGTSLTSRLTTTRTGTIAIGVLAAVVAAILILVYVTSYRDSVASDAAPTPVLVAKSLIPKGTSGAIIAQQEQFTTTAFPKEELKVGAITDPAYLQGRVATADVFPGQQLTAAEFSATTTDFVQTQITGAQRALAIPVAGPRHLVGTVQSGDRIDVYANISGLLKLLVPNAYVMRAPVAGTTAEMIIRAPTSALAARLALATDTTQLYFVLRPTSGAKKTPYTEVTLQNLLREKRTG